MGMTGKAATDNAEGQEALLDAGPASGDPFRSDVRVEQVRWRSDDGTFAVVEVSLPDGSPLVTVGALGHLEEGGRARVEGSYEHHSRHGLQVRVEVAEPLDPADAEGARRYLRSLPGIGRRRAELLVEQHGEDVFGAIDRDPEAAFAALKGVSEENAREAAAEWQERRAERRLYALLAPHGLAAHVGEIVSVFGESTAVEDVRADPYALTEISGIGFLSADRLAQACGIAPNAPERTRAAAVHVLAEAESRGHTHLPRGELVAEMRRLLDAEPAMHHLADSTELVVEAPPSLSAEGARYYRSWTHHAEGRLAELLSQLAAAPAAWDRPPLENELGELTTEQREAVRGALTRRLSLITGGPGTGKTHLTDALAQLAKARKLEVRLLAPTGRAARRLTQATNGAPAHTIHKALEWIPGEVPGRDGDAPLEADLVVVDEASMLSLDIALHLVAAIGPETHLVLIGDADQLPPVGPGKPFGELIESGLVPTVRLEHVFRQARRSMIVGAAHAIRAGRAPAREPGPDEIHDFFLHGRSQVEDLAADVVKMASERIPAQFGLDPVRQVQVLAPQYRGELGIDVLHARLRAALCADADACLEGRFRIGEKVIATRTLPEHGITNGSILIIEGADDDDGQLILESELGELITLPYREARILRGGFCTSVHKAQGIEVPAVIVCLHSSHAPQLLSRNLLYTAVTRAQKLCVLAGDRRALTRALRAAGTGERHSRLIERMARAS